MAILGRFIVEMMGAPPEYLETTLKNYIEKLKKAGMDIRKEDYAQAAKPKEAQLWSAFVELEISFKTLVELLAFCFDAMPSSVEIVQPEQMQFKSAELTDFLNDLQARLHQTDMVVKTQRAQQAITIFHNFIRAVLQDGAKTPEDLSQVIGVKPEELTPFLDKLLEQRKIVKEENRYALP